jgi:hypothetical protein
MNLAFVFGSWLGLVALALVASGLASVLSWKDSTSDTMR